MLLADEFAANMGRDMQELLDDTVAALAGTPFAEIANQLAARSDVPTFTPATPWRPALSAALLRLETPAESAKLLVSALLLWNDDLDASHTVSQDLPSKTGSLLHGIMHRREPDYGNAGYWYRRVGDHPIFAEFAKSARALDPENVSGLTGGAWDPFAMIDACRRAERNPDGALGIRLRELQLAELLAVVRYCAESGA